MTLVTLVHYTPPSVVGGVESVLGEHARLLRARGYQVQVVAGRPGSDESVLVIPEIDAALPSNQAMEKELMSGRVPPDFTKVRDAIRQRLATLSDVSDVLIVHNAFTLHFSLPLTAALFDLALSRDPGSTVAWCHDLSWTNPLYLPGMYDATPWNLLRLPAPGVRYVTVSELRRLELEELWGGPGDIVVVPNGIDVASFLRLSPETTELAERLQLWQREIVMLLPVRITRRKNIETAIRAMRELTDRGIDAVFLVSGPTAPHHPGRSRSYQDELLDLTVELGLESRVVFLARTLGHNLDYRIVSELYSLADVLIFPSVQEGFGVPILEAGLSRVPIVLSDIQIFREVAAGDAHYFPLESSPREIADQVLAAVATPAGRLFRQVLRDYRWEAIADQHLVPLVEAAAARKVST